MSLNDIISKSNAIQQEIVDRIHCRVEDLEVVQYDSGGIGIHWDAIYPRSSRELFIIPEGWIIHSILPSENRMTVYAEPGDFLCLQAVL